MHGARSGRCGCDANFSHAVDYTMGIDGGQETGGWVVLVPGEEDVGFVREGVGSWRS